MATMGPGDFLKVTYRGRDVRQRDGSIRYDDRTPLTLMWDARPYVCKPGESVFAPFEAVSIALGDPRSGESVQSQRDEAGNVLFVLDRPTEVRRLRTLYDNQLGDEAVILFAPIAEVEDLEGKKIRTVIDDPEGQTVTPVQTTVLDRDQLLSQVQRQQRMIERLAESQGIDLATGEPSPTEEILDADTGEPAKPTDAFSNLPEG